MPQMMKETNLTDIWLPRSRTPREERRDASVERSLAEVREAHQKAMALAPGSHPRRRDRLQLSFPLTWSQLEAQAHSQSTDCHRCRSRGQKRRHCQVWPEDCCAP